MSRHYNYNEYERIGNDDLLFVKKNTRGRHTLPKAKKDNYYLVVSFYENSLGTVKYIVLDNKGVEHFTTESAVEKVQDFVLSESAEWYQVKKIWMDRTYVPVFGCHQYAYSGMPFVSSRDGNSRLIRPLTKREGPGVWINKKFVHDDDVKLFLSSSLPPNSSKNGKLSEAVTFRIPVWLAEKNGFLMAVKANKETRDLVYRLCNGLRRESDICDFLMCYYGSQFYSREITEKAVKYHISKLKDMGLIYIKREWKDIRFRKITTKV